MADEGESREDLLRREFLGQTARIRWHELQTWFARGGVVQVAADMDLVEVAVQLGMDNSARFSEWIEAGQVTPVSDQRAARWYESNPELWAVVSPPWVLVQQRENEE